ncbi:MAG TPA: helix-turn-helix domain-containing protein, partial [Terrimesophilobacter sp.]|nr:helix-turn-helix domain-containing protein [Terrimesophilobacter sp.]
MTGTGTVARPRVSHDQESILLGAVEVFNRHGYDATSMGVLAENLGITKSAIYHHVPSKEFLLELALDR